MIHYFDNAATTPVRPEAVQAAVEAMTQGWGNPSSRYAPARQAAQRLEEHRAVYERHGVFSPRLIDGLVARLAAFRDADLRRELAGDEEKVRKLVETYFYCG